ncbi:hypothetical protein RFI_24402 [Reticulomyxa filosa]|uniref:Uncharacterized protein n=1 Tax=Reticulomyxa filosa TaxID=46433 RepID=X6MIT9_RETFI|nr:hypothetical protein RFI_24402 [Reticulomyxa filosa]|eukprot:ETO12975.1 hypothetical protein RFI_24402 [Reticulomyxa filosa]
MLFFAVALCLGSLTYAITCPNTGETPLTNSGINNYVVDWLELIDGVTVPFPFAIGKCTAHSLVTSRQTSYYHACSNGVMATQEFNDTQCITPIGQPKVWRIDNQTFEEVGYFECGGYNTYVELYVASNFSGTNVCSNLQHIFAGLNACVDQTDVLGQTFSLRNFPLFFFFSSSRHGQNEMSLLLPVFGCIDKHLQKKKIIIIMVIEFIVIHSKQYLNGLCQWHILVEEAVR